MSGVLTTGSTVKCLNGGAVQTSGGTKLTVAGNPVLIQIGIASKTISGCGHPVDANSSTYACTAVASVAANSFSTKLTTGGAGVALDTLSGFGNSTNPPDPLSAQAGQTKLTAS